MTINIPSLSKIGSSTASLLKDMELKTLLSEYKNLQAGVLSGVGYTMERTGTLLTNKLGVWGGAVGSRLTNWGPKMKTWALGAAGQTSGWEATKAFGKGMADYLITGSAKPVTKLARAGFIGGSALGAYGAYRYARGRWNNR
jgi:hypothetical protein